MPFAARTPGPWGPRFLTLALVGLLLLAPAPVWAARGSVQVEIDGIEGELLANVQAYLSLEKEKTAPMDEPRMRQLYRQAPGEIRNALEALGYYRPRIESHLDTISTGWLARFQITPGPPVRIAAVDFRLTGEGGNDTAFTRYQLPFKVGDVFRHDRYEEAKQALQSLASARGYFDAAFSQHRVTIRQDRLSADVVLHFDTGPRYRFGQVSFHQEALAPGFLQRFVPFSPGEAYTSGRLLAFQEALSNSGYFSRVDVEMPQGEAKGLRIPVEVTLFPLKRHRFAFGLGAGTDTGPRVRLDWEDRRVNRWGHTFSGTVEASGIRRGVSAEYAVPLADPMSERLSFQGAWKRENTRSRDSDILTLGVRRTTKWASWLRTLFVELRQETYTVGEEKGNSVLLLPGASWTRLRSDGSLYPRRGSRVTLLGQGTGPVLGSDTTFVQGRVSAKVIRPLGGAGRVLARLDVGSTLVSNFDKVPASLRFFAGGDESVRGYAYESLGPKDSSGDVAGGRHLLVGSVEYEHLITDKWAVAVFYDAGNAMDRWGASLKQGAGFGIRWRSPIGSIRLDLAAALSDPGTPLRLHFHMGPDL